MENPFEGITSRHALRQAWLEAAKKLHPDKGGDSADFAALHALYLAAWAYLSQPIRCSTCGGSGEVYSGAFTTPLKLCPVCLGSGVLKNV